ncbi:MAG: helix-turn-helix transcriptional regulator [Rikenellaceae bacterium]
MKEKITHLMKSEGLTTTRLAEILEIQPSAVSHLVSGRNKPGYDLLQKILRRFPRINPDWLLLDSGEPYRKDDDTIEDNRVKEALSMHLEGDKTPFNISEGTISSSPRPEQGEGAQPLFKVFPPMGNGSKNPIFVVLFYEDGSCESFSMRK